MISALGFILTAIGAAPVILAAYYWATRLRFARQVLSFSRKEPVDVVLTTSGTQETHRSVRRATTGIGQVKGTASFARILGRYYRSKPLRAHMSVGVTNRLEEDLVLLGGPLKNNLAKQFLSHFAQKYQDLKLMFDDSACTLRVKDLSIENFDPALNEGVPESDVAIIILDRNPFAPEWRRAILCAGFSSYGTAAAAEYLFEDLLVKRPALLRKKRRRWPKNSCFMIVVWINFVRDQVVEIHEQTFLDLDSDDEK